MQIPKPWTRDKRGRRYWYVTLSAQQILLGSCLIDDPAYAEIVEKVKTEYGKQIAGYDPKEGRQRAAKAKGEYVLTVKALAASFLEWVEGNLSQASIEPYRLYIRKFCKSIPDEMLVEETKPHHVLSWASEDLKHLGPTTINYAMTIIKRCFSWGADVGYYDHSPIARLKKPTARRRETLVTPDERVKLLIEAPEHLRELLHFIIDHGVRPHEVRHITAKHVDLASGLIELPPTLNKTGKRTGRGRKIWLTEQTKAIVTKLVEKYPQRSIFRTSRGGEWEKDPLCRAFARLREKCKITRPITLYSIRHGFATSGLIAGVDPATIAAAMGHTNPAMLLTVYQHVVNDQHHMKAASEKLAQASRGVSQSTVGVQAKLKRVKRKPVRSKAS